MVRTQLSFITVDAESGLMPAFRMRLRFRRPLVCVRVNETRRSQTEAADIDERLLCAPSPGLKALSVNEYASPLEATFNLGQMRQTAFVMTQKEI